VSRVLGEIFKRTTLDAVIIAGRHGLSGKELHIARHDAGEFLHHVAGAGSNKSGRRMPRHRHRLGRWIGDSISGLDRGGHQRLASRSRSAAGVTLWRSAIVSADGWPTAAGRQTLESRKAGRDRRRIQTDCSADAQGGRIHPFVATTASARISCRLPSTTADSGTATGWL